MRRFLPLAVLLLLPLQASAAEVLTWDFTHDGVTPWQFSQAVESAVTPEGPVIRTSADTVLLLPLPAGTSIDGFNLRAAADVPLTIGALWHPVGAGNDQFQNYPLVHLPAGAPTDIGVELSDIPGFRGQIDAFGFVLPAGHSVLLQNLSLQKSRLADVPVLWWRSFWTFDALTMRSINFLWGPRLAMIPAVLGSLYDTEPAGGISANGTLYVLCALGAAIGWLVGRRDRRRGVTITLAVLAGCWLLYDLRMSTELLLAADRDWREWVTAPAETQSFRGSGDAFRVLADLPHILGPDKSYALLTSEDFPVNFFRYATYPKEPLTHSGAQATAHDWMIFHRPDIVPDNTTLADRSGRRLTGTGGIVRAWSNDAYLFHTEQP